MKKEVGRAVKHRLCHHQGNHQESQGGQRNAKPPVRGQVV